MSSPQSKSPPPKSEISSTGRGEAVLALPDESSVDNLGVGNEVNGVGSVLDGRVPADSAEDPIDSALASLAASAAFLFVMDGRSGRGGAGGRSNGG